MRGLKAKTQELAFVTVMGLRSMKFQKGKTHTESVGNEAYEEDVKAGKHKSGTGRKQTDNS